MITSVTRCRKAPWAPYSSVRVGLWRNNWDTGAGVDDDEANRMTWRAMRQPWRI